MPDVPSVCYWCGYELRGLTWNARGRKCPECGNLNPCAPAPLPWAVRRPLVFDGTLLGGGGLIAFVGLATTWFGHDIMPMGLLFELVWVLPPLLGVGIVWLLRRKMSKAWIVWHMAIALIGIPLASIIALLTLFMFLGITGQISH